jgi:hypothetical protein
MKKIKIILLTTSLLFFSFEMFGQVKVQTNGQLTIERIVQGSTATSYGVHSTVLQGNNTPNGDCVGVYGYADASTSSFPAKYIGVLGTAHSTSSGTRARIGVAGIASYVGGSVGIFGGTYWAGLPTFTFTTTYAGYFQGNVYTTGSLTTLLSKVSSDERLKRNIEPINDDILKNLYALKPIKYNLQQIEKECDSFNTDGEKVTFMVKRYDEESQEFKKAHYGLIAQELQKVYPDLVYDGGDGYLEVNYTGLIPLLLQAVQELKSEIAELKRNEEMPVLPKNAPAAPQQETTGESAATLFQNVPNPFNENTEIAFYLPQSVKSAMLCVYDMNGKQLSQNVITQRGNASLVINGNQYGAGMYLYSLVADNQIVDTKRMILTK